LVRGPAAVLVGGALLALAFLLSSCGGGRETSCANRLEGEDGFEIQVESSKPNDPPLHACVRRVDGKPGLTVFNDRPIGLEFPVLPGVRVVETGHRTPAEQAWGPLNSIQYGEPWLLVPGDGFVTLAFDSVPAQIKFDATDSAFVFDLLMSVVPDPTKGFAQCAHNFAEAARASRLSVKSSLKKVLWDGVTACRKGRGAVIGLPAVCRIRRDRAGEGGDDQV